MSSEETDWEKCPMYGADNCATITDPDCEVCSFTNFVIILVVFVWYKKLFFCSLSMKFEQIRLGTKTDKRVKFQELQIRTPTLACGNHHFPCTLRMRICIQSTITIMVH